MVYNQKHTELQCNQQFEVLQIMKILLKFFIRRSKTTSNQYTAIHNDSSK